MGASFSFYWWIGSSRNLLTKWMCKVTHPPYFIMEGYVPEEGSIPYFIYENNKTLVTMIIPSIKEIFLFFTLNFFSVAFFNILLFKSIGFIAHVRFYDILTINTFKIGMLVSVFMLECFILSLLFLTCFLRMVLHDYF